MFQISGIKKPPRFLKTRRLFYIKGLEQVINSKYRGIPKITG